MFHSILLFFMYLVNWFCFTCNYFYDSIIIIIWRLSLRRNTHTYCI